jgi:hypothetical protein
MEVLQSLIFTIISLQRIKNSKFTQQLVKRITNLVTRGLRQKKQSGHLNQVCAYHLASTSLTITPFSSRITLLFTTTMLQMVVISSNSNIILSCERGSTISIIIILNLKGILRREDLQNWVY